MANVMNDKKTQEEYCKFRSQAQAVVSELMSRVVGYFNSIPKSVNRYPSVHEVESTVVATHS